MTLLEQIAELETKAKAVTDFKKNCNRGIDNFVTIVGEFVSACSPTVVLDLCTKLRKAVEALEDIAKEDYGSKAAGGVETAKSNRRSQGDFFF
jgi:hypothetical protein